LNPSNTALVVIDMQNDFLAENGYIAQMGYDVSNSRRTIEPVRELAAVMRERGFHIIWTREGHVPNLNDCHPVKYFRSRNTAAIGIGDSHDGGRVLVRGQEGFEIVEELTKEIDPTESIIDKLGKGSFVETELETLLRTQGKTFLKNKKIP
jgi:nicotinamidase-related amidase